MAEQGGEARLRDVLDAMAEGFALLGPDFTILDVNRETVRLDGRPREALIGRSHWQAFPGTEQSPLGDALRRVVNDRVPATLEHVYRWPDGPELWLDMRAYPAAGGGIAIFWRDITDRKGIEQALQASEEKYRALFESMGEAYAVVEVLKDADGAWVDFRFVDANPAFIKHTSMPFPVGKTATELLGTPNPRWAQRYGQALDTDRPLRMEEVEPTLGRTFDLNIFSLDRARNRVAVLFTDITDRRRGEERQKRLLAELQHRVRNILAMIRSIARRTGDTVETVEDYVQHLDGRLNALARTQVLLTRGAGAAVDLQGLILDELEMQAARADRYVLAGPDVELGSRAAEVLGLALHELATNAVKYGALSAGGGRIDVRWTLTPAEEPPVLRLTWTESGVPMMGEPDRSGFGTELVTRRVPYELRGTGAMTFRNDGLTAVIEFPLGDGASVLQSGTALPA